MQYHLGRDGSPLGEFPESEIRDGLSTGRFQATDLAWCAGMSDWKPLSEVLPQAASLSAAPSQGPSSPADAEVLRPDVAPTLSLAKASPAGVPPTPGWPAQSYPPAHVGMGVMPTPGTAIASLVLGIISLVTCSLGVVLVIPGLICGHLALNQIKAPGSQYSGKALAMTGLILNYVWLGAVVLGVIIIIAFGLLGVILEQFK
ncbi:DUF4190 domain-containing protein [Verrucomicrobium sp. BvORR106]|uniref:DUF4190 domain-containing protein n=1 Tax=Verrucomicrobium sp. BvORR106 TaxID=1403819 RepID=UPI00068C568F|nr:DUF4190 domain-containing protein [Verrucomicrobium sp. BvORR106]